MKGMLCEAGHRRSDHEIGARCAEPLYKRVPNTNTYRPSGARCGELVIPEPDVARCAKCERGIYTSDERGGRTCSYCGHLEGMGVASDKPRKHVGSEQPRSTRWLEHVLCQRYFPSLAAFRAHLEEGCPNEASERARPRAFLKADDVVVGGRVEPLTKDNCWSPSVRVPNGSVHLSDLEAVRYLNGADADEARDWGGATWPEEVAESSNRLSPCRKTPGHSVAKMGQRRSVALCAKPGIRYRGTETEPYSGPERVAKCPACLLEACRASGRYRKNLPSFPP